MMNHYMTSAEYLLEDLQAKLVLQITDSQTRHIFEARIRIAEDPD